MSTRCQIGYYSGLGDAEPVALIYKHSDGYPSDTLVSVAEFLKEFIPQRGIRDEEYCMAQLLVFLANRQNEYRTRAGLKADFLGFGICGDRKLHGDIEYLYKISPEGVGVWSFSEGRDLLSPEESREVLAGKVPAWVTEE